MLMSMAEILEEVHSAKTTIAMAEDGKKEAHEQLKMVVEVINDYKNATTKEEISILKEAKTLYDKLTGMIERCDKVINGCNKYIDDAMKVMS